MKNVCFHCGKGILMGRTHTHHRGVAGGRWKKRAPKVAKTFTPNLQKVRLMVGDVAKQVKLCTKCIKRVKKDIKDGKAPFVRFAALERTAKAVELNKVEVAKNTVKKAAKAARAAKAPRSKKIE